MIASQEEGLTQFPPTSALGRSKSLTSNVFEFMRGRASACAIIFCQTPRKSLILKWRDVRVVEGARLESVCRGNSTVGSNPTLSAN